MTIDLPEALTNLPANCGIYAIWMLLQHHGIQADIDELIQLTQYDHEEGTFSIALAIALKKMGFDTIFYTDKDPNIDAKERRCYAEAKTLNIPIKGVLSYHGIQQAIAQGRFVIVYYDNLNGVGNQSLVHSIDAQSIYFFDNFAVMSAKVFEKQRKAEGVCQQVIVIDDRNFDFRAVVKRS